MRSLTRRACTATLRLVLRIFFRRIEISGLEQVPATGPVICVLNHPNGLVDPLFILCYAPRPVSFLAKEPLFRMPVVGFFIRTFDSIPVYRRKDPGSDVRKNRETFARARELLAKGGALGLFPEGVSHDEPKLQELKTGAARIALGVSGLEGLRIIPAALYYTWKIKFRSGALLGFGEPIPVAPVELDQRGEPPREAARELTRKIQDALSGMTLQAESREALDLVRRAERIFSIPAEGEKAPLSGELDLRRRFAAGAALLQARDPARFAALRARIERFEAERKEAGLPLEHLTAERLDPRSLGRLIVSNLGALLLLPLAAVGAFLHYPAYRLAGLLADRFARGEEDVLATIKAGSSILLYPATWAAAAAAAGALFGWKAALAAVLLAPVSAWAALKARETLDLLVGRARALLFTLSRNYGARRLLAERRAIHEEIFAAASALDLT